jgi:two-component system cell cycle sensor histidine kinase/response regulator CckA
LRHWFIGSAGLGRIRCPDNVGAGIEADIQDMIPPAVLIVDDEPSVRAFAQQALTAAGYQTHDASNGAHALSLVEMRGSFDICLIDLVMPEMGGTELAQRIRRRLPAVKILYFTGYADQLFDEKRRLWDGEAFIEKPSTVNALREAVSLLLYGHTRGPETIRA